MTRMHNVVVLTLQVLNTHNQVLQSISKRFEAMCSVLLPSFEFTLSSTTGGRVGKG
jgi:hypothetical protein